MLRKAQTTLLLACLVSFIYVLRDNKATSGSFLTYPVSRALTERSHTLVEKLCSGDQQKANDISEGERSKASTFQSSLSKIRGGNPLIDFIIGPEPKDEFGSEYVVPIVKYAAPWIAFFVISLVGCISFCISFCCRNCCQKSKCCGRSESNKCKKFFLISSIAFMVCVVGAGIAGIIFSSGFMKGGNKTVCSVAVLLDKLIDGSLEEKWLGLELTISGLEAFLADYNHMTIELFKAVTTTSMVAFNIATGKDVPLIAGRTAVSTMYQTNRLSTISPRPDPAQSTNILSPASYVPDYVRDLKTITDNIVKEMNDKANTVDKSCLNTDIAIAAIKASDIIFYFQLKQAHQVAKNASKDIKEMEDKMEDIGDTGKSIVNGVGGGLAAIFSAEMVMGGIASASIIFLVLKGTMFLNKLLNVSWCTLGFLTTLGWALAAIMFPLSLILFEGCEVGNKALTEPAFFNQTFWKFFNESDSDNQTAQSLLYRCIHGDGDVIEELDLTTLVGVFKGMFIALDDMAVYTDSIQPVADSVIIPQQEKLINDYKTGLIPDASESTTDLLKLNSLTNAASNGCTQVQDTWVLNSASCSSAAGTVFQSTSSADFNVKNPTCIGYDNWANKNINSRYTSTAFPQTCAQQNGQSGDAYLRKFVDNFVDSRADVKGTFDSLSTSLGTVKIPNTAFMNQVKIVAANFNPVRAATKVAYQSLWDQNTGFIRNSNCTFVKQGTINLLDSMCVRFLSSLYEATVTMIVISFFSFFGVIMLFCLTKRLGKPDSKGKYDLGTVNSQ